MDRDCGLVRAKGGNTSRQIRKQTYTILLAILHVGAFTSRGQGVPRDGRHAAARAGLQTRTVVASGAAAEAIGRAADESNVDVGSVRSARGPFRRT